MALEFLRVKESDAVRTPPAALRTQITALFHALGMPWEDSAVCADVLVYADERGIDSHGVSNAFRAFYVPRLKDGSMNKNPRPRIVYETPSTARVNGDNGMGMVAGTYAMKLAIEKARAVGSGFVAVENSRHYGAAGYYAYMALEHDMIGFSMTNAGPAVLPTFGRQAMLGTNPIAIAAPAGEELPFVMDFATSTVAAQKMAVAAIAGAQIPPTWAGDADGLPTTDPKVGWESRKLLPLGGVRENGGHKGYSLAVMVDIFCGILSGAGYSAMLAGNCGHFVGAWRIDAFRPAAEFKAMMDQMIRALHAADKAPGEEKIYVAGEPDVETMRERTAIGIPLHRDVVVDLKRLAAELSVADVLPAIRGE